MKELDGVLKSYTCHKSVTAAEITSVGNYLTNRSGELVRAITLEGNVTIELPDPMFVRYLPGPGDFLVVYEDGYKSFSPRKAFLDGYTREEPNALELGAEVRRMEARDEIERLRGILLQCQRGPDPVDLGNGETMFLHLPHKGQSFSDIKQDLKK